MKLNDAFPGNWLKAADLGDDEHAVTIKEVRQEMVGQGQQAQMKLVMEFAEFEKPLVVNQTNAKMIAQVVGSDETDDWPGHRVTLYVNDAVQFGNEVVSAIRVRKKAPPAARAIATQARTVAVPPNGAGTLTYKQAVELCATAGLTEDDMKGWLKQNGLTGYNGVAATPLVRKLVAGLEPAAQPSDDSNDDIPF